MHPTVKMLQTNLGAHIETRMWLSHADRWTFAFAYLVGAEEVMQAAGRFIEAQDLHELRQHLMTEGPLEYTIERTLEAS